MMACTIENEIGDEKAKDLQLPASLQSLNLQRKLMFWVVVHICLYICMHVYACALAFLSLSMFCVCLYVNVSEFVSIWSTYMWR